MTKTLRVAVLTTVLALTAAPVFAGGDPGSNDPPPPSQQSSASVTMTSVALAILSGLAS